MHMALHELTYYYLFIKMNNLLLINSVVSHDFSSDSNPAEEAPSFLFSSLTDVNKQQQLIN